MARVTIPQGKLKGAEAVSENGFRYYEFLGIPYAKPPLGSLRFQNPQFPDPWTGEKDATQVVTDNVACQIRFKSTTIMGSEDCLYLNVFTPKLPDFGSKLLPVMVCIHGGGFIKGDGIIKDGGNPEALVENDVLVVTFNYRLNVFGFLSLDIPEAPGNVGLKDQVKALEWVQKNIGKFGGDKDNVTVFGVSAGSAAIEYLILSPMAKGLFHKAILQSGSSINDWAINLQNHEMTSKLLDKLNYTGNRDEKYSVYSFLLSISAEDLVKAAYFVIENWKTKSFFSGFVPTIEKVQAGAFLTTHPYKLLKEGNFAKVPVIRGFCNKEGAMMNIIKPSLLKELVVEKDFVSHWSYGFNECDRDKFNNKFDDAYYYFDTLSDDKDIAVQFIGDFNFTSGVWIVSNLFAKHGVTQYLYEFSYVGNMNATNVFNGLKTKGANHADDYSYIMKIPLKNREKPDDVDLIMISKMTKFWTNFAKESNPTPNCFNELDFEWPKFTETTKSYVNLNRKITIRKNYEPAKMAIFQEIFNSLEVLNIADVHKIN